MVEYVAYGIIVSQYPPCNSECVSGIPDKPNVGTNIHKQTDNVLLYILLMFSNMLFTSIFVLPGRPMPLPCAAKWSMEPFDVFVSNSVLM